jgi:hypothetical protein
MQVVVAVFDFLELSLMQQTPLSTQLRDVMSSMNFNLINISPFNGFVKIFAT